MFWVDKSIFSDIFSVYMQAPAENALIFMVDVSNSAFQSKMLYYFVAAAK